MAGVMEYLSNVSYNITNALIKNMMSFTQLNHHKLTFTKLLEKILNEACFVSIGTMITLLRLWGMNLIAIILHWIS